VHKWRSQNRETHAGSPRSFSTQNLPQPASEHNPIPGDNHPNRTCPLLRWNPRTTPPLMTSPSSTASTAPMANTSDYFGFHRIHIFPQQEQYCYPCCLAEQRDGGGGCAWQNLPEKAIGYGSQSAGNIMITIAPAACTIKAKRNSRCSWPPQQHWLRRSKRKQISAPMIEPGSCSIAPPVPGFRHVLLRKAKLCLARVLNGCKGAVLLQYVGCGTIRVGYKPGRPPRA